MFRNSCLFDPKKSTTEKPQTIPQMSWTIPACSRPGTGAHDAKERELRGYKCFPITSVEMSSSPHISNQSPQISQSISKGSLKKRRPSDHIVQIVYSTACRTCKQQTATSARTHTHHTQTHTHTHQTPPCQLLPRFSLQRVKSLWSEVGVEGGMSMACMYYS